MPEHRRFRDLNPEPQHTNPVPENISNMITQLKTTHFSYLWRKDKKLININITLLEFLYENQKISNYHHSALLKKIKAQTQLKQTLEQITLEN